MLHLYITSDIDSTVTFTTLANHYHIINCHHSYLVVYLDRVTAFKVPQHKRIQLIHAVQACQVYLGIYTAYMSLALNRSSPLWYFKFGNSIEICTRTMSNLYLGWPQSVLCYLPMQPTHGYRKSCLYVPSYTAPQDAQYTTHSQYYMIMNLWTHSQCIDFRNIATSSPPNVPQIIR